MTQTLAHGLTLQERFSLGFSDFSEAPGPYGIIMVTLGRPGSGKSHFWQSCPHAHIINADIAPISRRPCKASVWPAVRADGMPVVPNPKAPGDLSQGTPINLDWPAIRDHCEALISLAEENLPRPRIVVFDTVDLTYKLIQKWMMDLANERGREKDGAQWEEKHDFTQLFGMSAWPLSYKHFIDLSLRLKRAGYGVAWNVHIGDTIERLADNKSILVTDEPRLPGKFFPDLMGYASFVGTIQVENLSKTEIVSGKPVQKKETKYYLTADAATNRTTNKVRSNFPSKLELPKSDPWGTFETAYIKSIAQES